MRPDTMDLPEIATTAVGSCPVPEWLRAFPSAQAVRDAVLVVMKTQELVGIDVISDGEISRFDVNHPETNGMIETFVRSLGGMRPDLTMREFESFRAQPGMRLRKIPPAVVTGSIDAGTLKLAEERRSVKGLSTKPIKFTITSPYMLAKTVVDQHYRDIRALTAAIAEVLSEQVSRIDAPDVQVDEANLTGNPADSAWAFEPVNRSMPTWGSGRFTTVSATAGAGDPEGRLAIRSRVLERDSCRSRRARVRTARL